MGKTLNRLVTYVQLHVQFDNIYTSIYLRLHPARKTLIPTSL